MKQDPYNKIITMLAADGIEKSVDDVRRCAERMVEEGRGAFKFPISPMWLIEEVVKGDGVYDALKKVLTAHE